MKRPIALLFCLLMTTMPLAGCFGGGDDSSNAPDEKLDDWNVHFAATAADLPTCDEDTNGRLYYVEADNQFQVCKTTGWEIIDIRGADGVNGQDGADGYEGRPGRDGENGTNGSDGIDGEPGRQGSIGPSGNDGHNALIKSTYESAGPNCENGGIKIDVGIDDNDNGFLEPFEIDSNQYVCDGGSSANSLLTSYSNPPNSMGCDIGGSVIGHGLDNGDGGGNAANGQLESGEIDHSSTFCTRSTVTQIKVTENEGDYGSTPEQMTVWNGALYFVADSADYGEELWVYDGDGVRLVADINTMGDSLISSLTVFNNKLYFSAYGGVGSGGQELWEYDGEEVSMAQDINPGSGSSYPSSLFVFDNELYFKASDGNYQNKLWKLNGGMVSSGVSVSAIYLEFNNELYFRGYDGNHGSELWKYSESLGAVLVHDINPGSSSSSPVSFTVFNNELYFGADDGIHGQELWKYDGTNTPTMVADIWNGSSSGEVSTFTVFKNELYFTANTPGWENQLKSLWKYDGNSSTIVTNQLALSNWLLDFVIFNDELYFHADYVNESMGCGELWRHDGINPPSLAFELYDGNGCPQDLTVFNHDLYFSGSYIQPSYVHKELFRYSIQTDVFYT